MGVLSLSVRSLGVLSLSVRSTRGAEPECAEPGGAEPAGAEPGRAEPEGAEPGGAEPGGVESGGAEPGGAASVGVPPVALLELEALELEALELQALELEALTLEALMLEALALEVLDLEALELQALALEALKIEALELEAPELEALALEALALEALPLEALELEVLELEALHLHALELQALKLEVLELEALELEVLELEVLELEALCSSDRFSCRRRSCPHYRPSRCSVRFLVFLRPLPFIKTHRCLPPLVTLSSQSPLRSDVSLCIVLPPLFAQFAVLVHVPLPSPPASSLPDVPDPASDLVRAASPTVTRLLATVVTDLSFESTVASALVVELVDFAAVCRLDYAASLVAESESVCPPSVGGECALGTDVLEDRQEDFECLAAAVPHLVAMLLAPEGDPDALDIPTPRSYAEAISGPYSSQWQTAMDAEMASWKSTGTYVDAVPPPGANIVDGMWIFRGVDFFQTFSPTPKMTTLRVLLHVAAQRDYELHSLDFSTTFLQGSLHEEIWLRRPPGFTGSFPTGTQWSLRRPVYGLRLAPREWHDTLRKTLATLGFAPSTADPSLFLHTDTSLPPFYILVYVEDLVFATADIEALALVKSELQKRHTCTDLGELRSYLGLQITRDRARRTITLTQSHMVQQVL
ncbi:unnamed protein product [Closterium sp. Yama58-4]|nr:unnamed protein product [Closterium sp. Yama58-4]